VATEEEKPPRSFGLAAMLAAVILLGVLLVSLADFFPLTFHSSATMTVGLTPREQSDLLASFCTTLAHDANLPTGRLALPRVVADASLTYADHHRTEVDLKTARAMMRAALAAGPQDTTIAKLCAAAGHPIVSLNPEVHRPVSAATAAAGTPSH